MWDERTEYVEAWAARLTLRIGVVVSVLAIGIAELASIIGLVEASATRHAWRLECASTAKCWVTQEELAKAVDVTRQTIIAIERGSICQARRPRSR